MQRDLWGRDGMYVRPERTGWRDEEISKRHRHWGASCPAVDLDFLLVEYSTGLPVGLVEYKHFRAQDPNTNHPTYRALCELANGYQVSDRLGLPFFVAFYWPTTWAFQIWPINGYAKEHYEHNELMHERDYVSRLYRLRSMVVQAAILDNLNTKLPPMELRRKEEAAATTTA